MSLFYNQDLLEGYENLIDDKSLETSVTKMNQPASIVEDEA